MVAFRRNSAIALAIASIAIAGCGQAFETPEQRAERARAGQAAIARSRNAETANRKAEAFKNDRDKIMANVRSLMASKNWNAASLELSRWREFRDPELGDLETAVDREKMKIWRAEEAKRLKVEAAERLKAEKERRIVDSADRAARKRQGVSVGMTQEEVLMSNWGRPQSVNRSTYSFGTHEQWVYRGANYLYFENGKLVAIQNH